MNPELTILVNRLKEAGFDTRRFLKLNEKKAAYELEWEQHLYTPEEIEGTPCFGICGKDGLILIDSDRLEIETAIREVIPTTFEVESPRRKLRHFYLVVGGGKVENKVLHWKGEEKGCGEIRAQNYYLVAPGSEIKFKDLHTDEEKTGRYLIAQDRPIAKMQYADFMKAMEPYFGRDTSQKITFQQMREGVDEGTRHPQGIKYATFLIGIQQFDAVTALHAMREWNKLNRPPMNDADLVRMVENAIDYVKSNPKTNVATHREWFYIEEKTIIDKNGFEKTTTIQHFKPVIFAKFLLDNYHFKTSRDNKTIYIYNPDTGTYKPTGTSVIHAEMTRYLDERTRKHYYGDIEFYIQGVTFFDRPQITPNKLACLNGILNVETHKLEPFTPDEFILTQIPVKYDSTVDCPQIRKFLEEVVNKDQLCMLQEIIGYNLYQAMPIHKATMLVGEGANGKSTLIELIKKFLGDENVSNVSLQSLCENRFAAAALYGRLANLFADLPDKSLAHTGMFKMLSGNDTITGEEKFKPLFSFKNHAKQIYSCNKIPETNDDTVAFFRRWNIIMCPNYFVPGNPNILIEIATPQELSGLLNYALQGLHDLLEKAQFCNNETTEQIRGQYIRQSNSAKAYIEENLEESLNCEDVIPEAELYSKYIQYCSDEKLLSMKKKDFTINLKQYMPTVRQTKTHINKVNTDIYQYIKHKSAPDAPGTISKTTIQKSILFLSRGAGATGAQRPASETEG